MLKYVGKRLLMFIPTIFIISLLIFFVIQLPPGDYVTSYVAAMEAEGEIFTAEEVAALRERYGLDDPWFIQYFNWMKGIITEGDFGYSFHYSLDVWDVIMQRLWLTLGVSFVILVLKPSLIITFAPQGPNVVFTVFARTSTSSIIYFSKLFTSIIFINITIYLSDIRLKVK